MVTANNVAISKAARVDLEPVCCRQTQIEQRKQFVFFVALGLCPSIPTRQMSTSCFAKRPLLSFRRPCSEYVRITCRWCFACACVEHSLSLCNTQCSHVCCYKVGHCCYDSPGWVGWKLGQSLTMYRNIFCQHVEGYSLGKL